MTAQTADKLAKKFATIEMLLAKAESTNFPAEAELAMAQAEKMMIQYGFERAEFNGDNRQDKVMVQVRFACTGTYHLGKVMAYSNIASAYQSVEVLRLKGQGSTTYLILIGEQGDVDNIVRVLNSLDIQAEHAVKSWWATNPPATMFGRQDGWKARRDFIVGFGRGAAQRVRESLVEVVREGGTGTELVLVNRMKDAAAHREALYPVIRHSKSRMHGGLGGRAAGHAAGLEANIGTKAMGGTSRGSLGK